MFICLSFENMSFETTWWVRGCSIFIFNLVNVVCFSSFCLLLLCRQNEMLMWEKWTNPKWPRRRGELLCYFKRICNLICTHRTTGRDMRSCVSLWKLLPLHHISATHAWSCLPSPLSACNSHCENLCPCCVFSCCNTAHSWVTFNDPLHTN